MRRYCEARLIHRGRRDDGPQVPTVSSAPAYNRPGAYGLAAPYSAYEQAVPISQHTFPEPSQAPYGPFNPHNNGNPPAAGYPPDFLIDPRLLNIRYTGRRQVQDPPMQDETRSSIPDYQRPANTAQSDVPATDIPARLAATSTTAAASEAAATGHSAASSSATHICETCEKSFATKASWR